MEWNIDFEEAQTLSKTGDFLQTSHNGIIYDSASQPNPDYFKNNNSRNGFLYSCYYHPKGKFFQEKIKASILYGLDHCSRNILEPRVLSSLNYNNTLRDALYTSILRHISNPRKQTFMFNVADFFIVASQDDTIIKEIQKNIILNTSVNFAHKSIKLYDHEAYTYSDPRLNIINTSLKSDIYLQYPNERKILFKIIDICIFLMKEDIYYRPRWLLILQDLYPHTLTFKNDDPFLLLLLKKVCDQCKDFALTSDEIDNITTWD